LVKEIQFIEDYIDIQKMRVVDSVEIIFNKTGDMNQSLIGPMLLFPFVENAFKHGISYNENSKIEIDLKVDHDLLMFSVSNYIFRTRGEEPTKKHAGIGLQNVIKRLNIQYKNKHKISIKNNDFTFLVKLKLELI
jgi:two-component system, LytTR family, sensor kinase